MSGPLPPLGPATISSDVRAGGPKAVQGYRAAVSFERQLLTKMLTAALPEPEEPEEGEGGEGDGPQVVAMPEAIADAIVSAGGAGLAGSLYGGAGTGP